MFPFTAKNADNEATVKINSAELFLSFWSA